MGKGVQTCSTAACWSGPDWLPADRLPGGGWYPEGDTEACCGGLKAGGPPSGRSRPVGGGSGGNMPPAGAARSPATQDSSGGVGCRFVLEIQVLTRDTLRAGEVPNPAQHQRAEVTCKIVTTCREPPGKMIAVGELSGPAAGYITPALAQKDVSIFQGRTLPAGKAPGPGPQHSAPNRFRRESECCQGRHRQQGRAWPCSRRQRGTDCYSTQESCAAL